MERVTIFDADLKQWLQFEKPLRTVRSISSTECLGMLRLVEQEATAHNLFAAGFISYEAAPAFDAALQTHSPGAFPVLWFGLFEAPTSISLRPPDASAFNIGGWIPTVERDRYDANIRRIQSHITEGDTYQVNYSFRLNAPFEGDAYELFLQLVHAQPSSNGAFIDAGDFAICSISPELFFLLDGDNIITRPMKGTAPRGLTLLCDKQMAESLRASEKNRAENLMIVDMIRNDLGRIAEVGSVHVRSLFDIERYPTVWQMTSTVVARTKASVEEIMTALFPCASVTGAPKPRTMEIISGLESTPRKIYTGAIGFIAPNRKAQFNVAIRTVLIDKEKGQAEYGVGGGVVWASTAEGEHEECLTKARVLTDVRPEFELFETILFTGENGFFLLDEHLARLKDSSEYFGFEYNEEEMLKMLRKAREGFSNNAYRIRLKLHPKGLPSLEAEPVDTTTLSSPVRVRFAKTPIDSKNPFLYHKTTHRKVYDDALASVLDCDDVILRNERDEVTESTIANVVVEIDGELYTPPVECGLLAGTLRAKLLGEGKIKERPILLEEFRQSPRIVLVNSVRGWREARLVK